MNSYLKEQYSKFEGKNDEKSRHSNPFTSTFTGVDHVLTAPMIQVADYMTENTIDIVKELLENARRLLAAQVREAERIEGKKAWEEENDALGGGDYLYRVEFREEWQ